MSNKAKNNELDLFDLLNILWIRKLTIFIFFLLFLTSSVYYAFSIPDEYTSKVLLAPNSEDKSSSMSSLGALGGVAALAGANIKSGSNKISEGLAIIKSLDFFKDLLVITEDDLKVALIAAKGWDPKLNELVIDPELYDKNKKTWIRKKPDQLGEIIPSAQETHLKFLERVSITEDVDTGLISISITFYSPYMAKNWLDNIVKLINKKVRDYDVNEAKNSNLYLYKTINETDLPDVRETIASLIQDQVKTIMLAESNPQYLFKVIQTSYASEKKSGPKRLLILLSGSLLGVLFGMIFVLSKSIFLNRD